MNKIRQSVWTEKARPYFIFTVIFLVVAVCTFGIFLLNDRTFLRFHNLLNKDSFSQRYMYVFEFKHFLENLFRGGTLNTWDWSIGLGADALAFNISNLFNPFSYITAFTPDRYVDVVYSLTIAARIYLSGLAFILFARKTGIDDLRCVIGGIIYSFSPWIMIASVLQGHFLIATILLPLVMLGEEKVLRGESPVLFILSVAYTLISSFSFAYMVAILTFLYFGVRYFTYYRNQENYSLPKVFAIFMTSGVIGVMISGISLVITFLRLSHSTAISSRVIVNVYSFARYARFPLHLMDFTEIFGSNSVISASALCIVMIPLILYSCIKLKTNPIMTAILLAGSQIPFVNRFFNFMSYESGRWMFAIAFFFSLAAVECLDEELLKRKNLQIAVSVFVGLLIPYLLWLSKVLADDRKIVVFTELICSIIIAAMLIFVINKNEGRLSESLRRKLYCSATLVTVLGLIVSYNVIFSTEIDGFLKVGEADRVINSSPQRVGAMIKDNDFYRIDQVDESTGSRSPHCKVNEAMYFGNRSNYVFYSSVDVGWLEYNKLLGNNQGYFKRVAPNSNDQRFGLDFLQGTKYFIGNSKEIDTANDYAGFGYEPYKVIDGVDVLKNRYNIGIGCMFTQYMYKSEWLKLDYVERELAMLDAVILPDGQKAPAGMSELKASDTDYAVRKVHYKKDGKGRRFRLIVDTTKDEQVILSMKNYQNSAKDRMKAVFYYSTVHKVAVKTENDERGFSDIDDITVNFGNGGKETDVIKVILKRLPMNVPDVHISYDDLSVYAVPNSSYQKAAEALVPGKLNIETFDNDYIKGTVNAEKDGILYLSILDNNGWDVYVDGKKAEKREEVDIAFSGVDLKKGSHTIELKYHTNGFMLGILVSLCGIIAMVIFCHIMKKLK